MKKRYSFLMPVLFGVFLSVGCGSTAGGGEPAAGAPPADQQAAEDTQQEADRQAAEDTQQEADRQAEEGTQQEADRQAAEDMQQDTGQQAAQEEQTGQAAASPEDAALTAYLFFVSGDRTLLADGQSEMWYIPDFQDESMEYEYTCMDLDGDGVPELLVQMEDNPCGYNAVFHFEDGKLFCWNSDTVELSHRDYPLSDGTMVRQYDYAGTTSYMLFRYQEDGEEEELSTLFVREELIPEDSPEPCPYYAIDGQEVAQSVFEEQLEALVKERLLDRSAWTAIEHTVTVHL